VSVTVIEESGRDPLWDGAAADKAIVDEALALMKASADKWEAILAEQDATTFEASAGDVTGVANIDGRLIELSLSPDVMNTYTYPELQARINAVLDALRQEVTQDFEDRYGSGSPLE